METKEVARFIPDLHPSAGNGRQRQGYSNMVATLLPAILRDFPKTWKSNLSRLRLLGFGSRRLHSLNLLLRQGQSSRDGVRPRRGEVHQRVNPIPEQRKGRHAEITDRPETLNSSCTEAPLTWHPPGICQAPKEKHGSIWRTQTHKDEHVEHHLSCYAHNATKNTIRLYLSWTPSLSSCLISAMMALGSNDLVFSSTQFSGSKSVDKTQSAKISYNHSGNDEVSD